MNHDPRVFPQLRIEFIACVFFIFIFSVFKTDCSPGPGQIKVESSITRVGLDGTPCYSMLGRQRDGCKCSFNENTLILADAGVFSAIGHYVIGTCCFENDV